MSVTRLVSDPEERERKGRWPPFNGQKWLENPFNEYVPWERFSMFEFR